MLKKAAVFTAILFAVIAATSVVLAILEPGSTDPGELGRSVGRLILPIVLLTTLIYFGAKRMGWILKGPRAHSRVR